jgi:hypothetical protein
MHKMRKYAGKLALGLAMALAAALPAQAGVDWFQSTGTYSWRQYNYLNFERRELGNGSEPWYVGNFDGNNYQYLLNYVTNSSTTGQCYELEIGPPEAYPASNNWAYLWFWSQEAGGWADLLGQWGEGKGRLWLKNSEFQVFIGTNIFPGKRHNGYYLSRRNLTEDQCTTGQTTMNWLKIKDGVQSSDLRVNW